MSDDNKAAQTKDRKFPRFIKEVDHENPERPCRCGQAKLTAAGDRFESQPVVETAELESQKDNEASQPEGGESSQQLVDDEEIPPTQKIVNEEDDVESTGLHGRQRHVTGRPNEASKMDQMDQGRL